MEDVFCTELRSVLVLIFKSLNGFSWIIFIAGFDQYCQFSIHTLSYTYSLNQTTRIVQQL